MEDDHSMSDRILRTLETILNNDPDLKDFTIIPSEANIRNKSPVLCQEHSLGLESWCIKHIYRYAYLELFGRRKLRKKLKDHNLNRLLIGVLLINPDVSTFWNMKRELVQNDIVGACADFHFTRLVLSHKSKSNEAFAYRRWLIARILTKIPSSDSDTPLHLLQTELSVCELAALKSPNNYHAWTHRIWCMQHLACRAANLSEVVRSEIEFSRTWVSDHVSEHTGFHYRQFLFSLVRSKPISLLDFYCTEVVRILGLVNDNDPSEILTFLLGRERHPLDETTNFLNFVCLLLYDLYNLLEMLDGVFPGHEAVWYHRRYLLYHLVKTGYEYHGLLFKPGTVLNDVVVYGTNVVNLDADGEKQPKLFKSQPNRVESCLLYRNLVKHEGDFVKKSDQHLAQKYEKWLKFVVCMEDI